VLINIIGELDYVPSVTMLTIQISWEYALGIIGAIIAGSASIAWYASGRLTALEISMDWVKRTLIELKVAIENANALKPAYKSRTKRAPKDTSKSLR